MTLSLKTSQVSGTPLANHAKTLCRSLEHITRSLAGPNLSEPDQHLMREDFATLEAMSLRAFASQKICHLIRTRIFATGSLPLLRLVPLDGIKMPAPDEDLFEALIRSGGHQYIGELEKRCELVNIHLAAIVHEAETDPTWLPMVDRIKHNAAMERDFVSFWRSHHISRLFAAAPQLGPRTLRSQVLAFPEKADEIRASASMRDAADDLLCYEAIGIPVLREQRTRSDHEIVEHLYRDASAHEKMAKISLLDSYRRAANTCPF